MRIGFFLRDLKVEGVQVVTLRLAETLTAMGHRCDLITLNSDQELLLPKNVQCHNMAIEKYIPYKDANKYTKYFLSFLNKIESDEPFRAVFSVHGETNDIISFINDKRFVHCIHNSDEHSYNNKGWVKKFKFKRKLKRKIKDKHVLCVSQGIRKFVKEHAASSYSSLSTIYNSFNIEKINRLAGSESVYPLPNDYIVFVGRLEKQKNLLLLLDVLLKMKSNIPLIIIGQGRLEEAIMKRARELGIQERVVIYPFCQNPYPIIKKAKVLVLTSLHEGLPTVLIEALILGTPVLSTNCPTGPSEILVDDLKKYLVDSYDAEIIAKRVDDLLLDNINININKEVIRNKFGSDSIGKEYISFIEGKGL
ncbi:hypothetical protein C9J44_09700 [Photobacterium sp. GB-27]|uniref:glycosyltransferase n=1 Tax=Photobacterium sp. GB-27 TaxID=2022109 RepID=UPI000D177637|nr:glycosyltransferase [Photobacterium sp. GB-27]PSV36628.1 hypothetical protein C9J44_09700 [Photobacterium sp. GB-27]